MKKLELKNVKFSEWNSEETNCFQAMVYFEGKRVAIAHNDGRGGCTWASPIDDNTEGFKAMRDYCEEYRVANEHYDTFTLIDLIFEEWLEKRDAKQHEAKMQKEFNKGICYSDGTPNAYRILTFKIGGKPTTVAEMLGRVSGQDYLAKSINRLKAEGYEILNTNLPIGITTRVYQ